MAYDELGFYREPKKKGRKVPIVLGILAAAATAVAIGCLVYIFCENKPMNDEREQTGDLRGRVVIDDAVGDDSLKVDKGDWSDGLDRRIDFEYLRSVNPDVYCWLYMENPYVDLPVMQEQEVGSTYYLYHDYEGYWNVNGSLLTPKIPEDLEDAHMLIFGHNMGTWSQVMFSALPQKFHESSFAKGNQYIYLYYPDRAERLKLWAAVDSDFDDIVYEVPYTLGSDSYGELLDNIFDNKLYYVDSEPDKNEKTVVLSTCTGDTGSQTRFYLAYKMDAVRYYDNSDKNSAETQSLDKKNKDGNRKDN